MRLFDEIVDSGKHEFQISQSHRLAQTFNLKDRRYEFRKWGFLLRKANREMKTPFDEPKAYLLRHIARFYDPPELFIFTHRLALLLVPLSKSWIRMK